MRTPTFVAVTRKFRGRLLFLSGCTLGKSPAFFWTARGRKAARLTLSSARRAMRLAKSYGAISRPCLVSTLGKRMPTFVSI